jgi:hypothetical protein
MLENKKEIDNSKNIGTYIRIILKCVNYSIYSKWRPVLLIPAKQSLQQWWKRQILYNSSLNTIRRLSTITLLAGSHPVPTS